MRFVKFEKEGEIARIIFNRPEVGNAFNGEMLKEIKEIAERLSSNENVRVVILEGEGKHFCAGGDLRWMREMAKAEYSENYKDALLLF
jgi:Enoyl-CoA hydratase/carnithine racemase